MTTALKGLTDVLAGKGEETVEETDRRVGRERTVEPVDGRAEVELGAGQPRTNRTG